MEDSTAAVANRPIVPIFFVKYSRYSPQKIETMVSLSHSPRYEPHNPTGSWND
jgi:hypothetical protein